MDTFQELEHEIIEYMSKICPIKAVRGDFWSTTDNFIQWLDSKHPSTVVYVSFGSIVHLKQEQADDIAYGLLYSGLSFLWAMKPPPKELGPEPLVLPEGFLKKAGHGCQVLGDKLGIRMSRGEAEIWIIPPEDTEKCLQNATTGTNAAELKENLKRMH
ncbi:UDP-glycosyltransferase 84A1 [Abeliophyllum distichum]|uniref:UDP-glycosyltransferase 84A1 n=1 Tax=Abeliophyllum distichum TaxID=126358 RepID=A0ABD1Q0Q6_9LAMI